MRAIILAAGHGARIKKFHSNPKGFIKIPKIGLNLIERNIKLLKKNKISKILIVTGFKSYLFKDLSNKKVVLHSVDKYKKYNNYYSLFKVKKFLKGTVIILFSDILIHKNILSQLIKSRKKICLVIDKNKKLRDTMRVLLEKQNIVDIGAHIDVKKADGNFVGIAKFNSSGSKFLRQNLRKNIQNFKEYYVKALNLPKKKKMVNYLDVRKKFWMEIDNKKDLNKLRKVNIKNFL